MAWTFFIMPSSYGVTNSLALATIFPYFATLSRHVAAFSANIAPLLRAVAPP